MLLLKQAVRFDGISDRWHASRHTSTVQESQNSPCHHSTVWQVRWLENVPMIVPKPVALLILSADQKCISSALGEPSASWWQLSCQRWVSHLTLLSFLTQPITSLTSRPHVWKVKAEWTESLFFLKKNDHGEPSTFLKSSVATSHDLTRSLQLSFRPHHEVAHFSLSSIPPPLSPVHHCDGGMQPVSVSFHRLHCKTSTGGILCRRQHSQGNDPPNCPWNDVVLLKAD